MKFILNCTAHWWRGGSVCRASDSRSIDPRFEPRLSQDHKKHLWEFFRVNNVALARCRCAQPPPNDHFTDVNDPVVHARVRWIMETRSIAPSRLWKCLRQLRQAFTKAFLRRNRKLLRKSRFAGQSMIMSPSCLPLFFYKRHVRGKLKIEKEIGTAVDEMEVFIDLCKQPPRFAAFLVVFWRWQPVPEPQQHRLNTQEVKKNAI